MLICSCADCARIVPENARNAIYETARRPNGLVRLLGGHVGAWPGLVVGNGLKVVGPAEKPPQLDVNARIILHGFVTAKLCDELAARWMLCADDLRLTGDHGEQAKLGLM